MSPLIEKLARTISYVTCFTAWRLRADDDESSFAGLSKFLPAAGLVIGIALAAVAFFLHALQASSLVVAALLTICWFAFTQGLHLDGLMDAADGIFSHQSTERMLEIMQDSRVGNFGVIIGVCTLLAKCAALSALDFSDLILVVLIVPAWARWCEVYAIGHFPYLREYGKGKIWHESIDYPNDLYRSALVPGVVSLLLAAFGQWALLAVVVGTITAGMTAAQWLATKLGGHTGDTYGAVVELSEACAVVLAALVIH